MACLSPIFALLSRCEPDGPFSTLEIDVSPAYPGVPVILYAFLYPSSFSIIVLQWVVVVAVVAPAFVLARAGVPGLVVALPVGGFEPIVGSEHPAVWPAGPPAELFVPGVGTVAAQFATRAH